MKVSRSNEDPRIWFRSERVYLAGDKEWFFQTREGVDVGPYESQFEAEIEAGLLKELLQECDSEAAVMQAIREFVLDAYGMGRKLSPRFRDGSQVQAAVSF